MTAPVRLAAAAARGEVRGPGGGDANRVSVAVRGAKAGRGRPVCEVITMTLSSCTSPWRLGCARPCGDQTHSKRDHDVSLRDFGIEPRAECIEIAETLWMKTQLRGSWLECRE